MYYFRPYNADTVLQHRAQISQWNGNPSNPYSVSIFDAINEDFSQRFSQVIPVPAPTRRGESQLQNLEDLLLPTP